MPNVFQAGRHTAPSGPDEVDLRQGRRHPAPAPSLTAGHLPAPAEPRTAGRPRSTNGRPDGSDGLNGAGSVDRSGRYLVAAVLFTLVALTGAVTIVASHNDVVGAALLLSGDALIIVTWVDYVRRPTDSNRPGRCGSTR